MVWLVRLVSGRRAYVRFAYVAINVSAALNRRGMRHESSIQSSSGWRQPSLFLPRADILYGLCRATCRTVESRGSQWGSTIDDWRLTASFYYNAVSLGGETRAAVPVSAGYSRIQRSRARARV